ncbi:cytochrome b-c1 complex subunit 8 [Yarrowia lipolytica]|uniref:Cytochrome b-c1 complex subunit 8 n=2 Tax=Yarrowia lipolytica TaxID=4952 RepID=Q6C387_YARLI|nr:YALI0F01771p [Yarrowia lipolytica CLIB122]8AB6_H Chain H, Cytochrome b-c1 complex subunit 8 [Yarrowia lipolytica]8AB6_S Chain S, Cytochrome b-c1 complex subunit 8 [Yarrowia lipolytica]8AB7_H Chain H, Cytochrome b-c1 complex subunit 8 [Yarrowia lipolytica]8AB7_S Chain S, Cytochrome b-c1 complex subunit 8 [Yarrowia lipolytica]8AB8_H Chain H, Cytochrome b-c1 complex subunit 8 [Yarrowia lipolytica]8AB8_S Chain S, Cytochrome b-c1 complex subunit 8 [Yarrowia lipolytica]8AB9_H Chain H, Cytochrom|eukprot:XP_504875.1 YALI0F01771p [Yarrowia lipolytica CLIB122]
MGGNGHYMGWWGHMGSPPQKGIAGYTISPFAARPFAGVVHAAIFNTFRRTKNQALFVILPVSFFYYVWTQASEKNEWLYTKAGRHELAKALAE